MTAKMMKNGAALVAIMSAMPALASAEIFAPKVLVMAMFEAEAAPWMKNLDLPRKIAVPGLPAENDTVSCNDDLCIMTTTMGYANAASSAMAVGFSDQLDLKETYILIAGIAGVDPENGTLGSAAWADQVVDGGLFHRIDRRDAPEDWSSQIVELGAKAPGEKPEWTAGTEIFTLNPDLVAFAFDTTKDVDLADGEEAATYRANYTQTAAKAEPQVMVCASVSADTYWHGVTTAKEVSDHVNLLTDGSADYCMSQMEDNATLTALSRAAHAGRLDMDRIAVLRTASNFDRAYEGQDTAASLSATSGGFGPATENAYRVGHAFALAVISDWARFAKGPAVR